MCFSFTAQWCLITALLLNDLEAIPKVIASFLCNFNIALINSPQQVSGAFVGEDSK